METVSPNGDSLCLKADIERCRTATDRGGFCRTGLSAHSCHTRQGLPVTKRRIPW